MNAESKPSTANVNGRLWGQRAADWSNLMEPQFRPLYDAAFKAAGLQPGWDCLDVGCGAGLALQIAEASGARVSGVDAASPLLAVAQSRVPAANLYQGDLETLPFDDRRFDLVTGFNAFQYAGNPVLALAEARRVTRPGGMIVVATWGPPQGMPAASLVAALKPLLPPPPPGAPGPFALSEEATLQAFARDAGLLGGRCIDVQANWQFETLALGLRALKSSGVGARAIDHAGEAAVDEAHAAAMAPFSQADGSYQVAASFRCLIVQA
jgi:SAM-dependent methyltransferase